MWPVSRRKFLHGLSAFAALPLLRAEEPDVVLYNGDIWTVDESQPRAQAVAIIGGKFAAVGSNDEVLHLVSARTRKIDLGMKSVLPGFNDAHSHPCDSGVEHLHKVACDSDSIEKIQAALHERAQKAPPGQWVLGFLYDDGKTPHPLNLHDLDAAVPDHPVIVQHRGGHVAFVNSMALKMAKVDDGTPDPTGGRFEHEVVPIRVPQKKGEAVIVARDEGIRADSTPATLAKLRPLLEGGTVTAGNSSQQNDAAAACLVVSEHALSKLGLQPAGYLVGWAAAGCHPATMGIGPVPAVRKLFARTGLGFAQMDLVELNEAFACQVLAVLKGWSWNDRDRLNVNGSGISLGHPIGATGVRILATLLHELERRQGRFGLETMCIGGGQGIAAIFERAAP